MKSHRIASFSLLVPFLLYVLSIILDYYGSKIEIFNNFLNKPTELTTTGGGTLFFYSWKDYLSFQFKWYSILIFFFGGIYCIFNVDNKMHDA